ELAAHRRDPARAAARARPASGRACGAARRRHDRRRPRGGRPGAADALRARARRARAAERRVTPAAALYARGLAGTALHARVGGDPLRLPVERWTGPATDADRRALAWADGPVLDVGCGPG